MLTVVVPVKERLEIVEAFMKENLHILRSYKVIVVDSGGGFKLKRLAHVYLKTEKSLPFWEARKLGYGYANSKYTLNLDSDVVVSKIYVSSALQILENSEEVGAVSVFFQNNGETGIATHRGVLAFGASVWRSNLLKELYDYDREKQPKHYCECLYMWEKLEAQGYRLETLPYRARHLR